MAKAKRLKPTSETLREIFLKSGNLCAFPDCMNLMMDREGVFIGQVCHIEAAEDGGERFNEAMTDQERRSFPNLMLMCYEHHSVTNDVIAYPVPTLQAMKAEHEARFTDPERAIDIGEEARNNIVQQGDGNRAVAVGKNTGTIIQGDTHHYHGNQPAERTFQPSPAEVEILTRLADSPYGYLNAIKIDGGFEVLIDGKPLGGGYGPSAVALGEAVQRLLKLNLLTDIQYNGEVFHLGTKGTDAARQIREWLDAGALTDFGELERAMPKLFEEMREDLAHLPYARDVVLIDRRSIPFSGKGVLVYYSSEHEHLENFFGVLRGKGLVDETTYNDLKRFRITERFARYLIQGR